MKVDCTRYALVTDVAKELGVKKTVLMQYIEDHPKLFRTVEAVKTTRNTKKSLGLAISNVYLCPESNPDTEEWLELMRKKWEKKVHVSEQTYYGQHEYWCIPEDDPKSTAGDSRKFGLYRNTPEKIKFLKEKGIIKKVSGGYGGFSDFYRTEYYPYSEEIQKALEGIGWTTDFEEVRSQ